MAGPARPELEAGRDLRQKTPRSPYALGDRPIAPCGSVAGARRGRSGPTVTPFLISWLLGLRFSPPPGG